MQYLTSNPDVSQIIESFLPELTQQIHLDEQQKLNQEILERLELKKTQLKSQYNSKLEQELETSHSSFNEWYRSQSLKYQDLRAEQQTKRQQDYSITSDEEQYYMKKILTELVDSQMLKEIKDTLSSMIEKSVAAKYKQIFEEEAKKIRRSVQESDEIKKAEEIKKYEETLLNRAADQTESLLKERQRIEEEKGNIKIRVEREKEEHRQLKGRYEEMTDVYSQKIEEAKKDIKELKDRFC